MRKKRISLLLAALTLLALLAPACAFAADGPELPSVGEKIDGFTVTGIYPYLGSQLVAFEHEQTGAPLLWVANDSTDRAFLVGFRTLVYDDEGIPHVFEHAATSGGEKYPNPNQFEAGVYGTYNTFMNALTYTTYTLYPCASLSEDQLLRYADYYLDGVYHPLLLSDERFIRREAYRYVLPDPDAELTVQGTVYSEMLGAITQDRAAYTDAMKLTFPGSAISSEVGGKPGEIEKITQQQLADFHAKYYHPSNSLMVLYGDLDVSRFLEMIDGEYLSHYERKQTDLSDASYTPITGDVEREVTFPVSANDAAETIMLYTIPLEGLDLTGSFQLNLAVQALTASGQPLDAALKERLPGVSLAAWLNTDGPCMSLMFEIYGAQPEQKDEVVSILREGIAAAARDGLDPELLASAVLSERFDDALRAENVSAAQAAMDVATLWGAQGDPLAALEEEKFSQNLQADLDAGAFDAALRTYLLDPPTTSLLVSTGVPGLLEEQDEANRAALAAKKAAMSAEEIDALIAEGQAFDAWQEENAATVSVAPLAAVTAQSLPEEVVSFSATDADADGLRVVSGEVDSDMIRVGLYLDASAIAPEQLDKAALAAWLMGELSTAQTDRQALQVRTRGVTNGVSAYLSALRREDWSYTPYLTLSFDCFADGLDGAFDLAQEMLFDTVYGPDEVRAVCAAQAAQSKAAINPSNYANTLAQIALDESAAYNARTTGTGIIRTMEQTAKMDGEALNAYCAELGEARNALLTKGGMILTVIGSAENIDAVTARAQALRERLHDTAAERADYAQLLAAPKNVAAPYGSGSMYNLLLMPMKDTGVEYSGKLLAFANVLDNLVLTPVLRHANSVYTPYAILSRDWLGIMAYRDPRLGETFTQVYPSLSTYVRELDLSQEELDGYITSAFSELAKPYGPFAGTGVAIADALCERPDTFARTLERMRELKQTTVEDIHAYADLLDTLCEQGARVSVGNPQLIEANRDLFDAVDTWLTE